MTDLNRSLKVFGVEATDVALKTKFGRLASAGVCVLLTDWVP